MKAGVKPLGGATPAGGCIAVVIITLPIPAGMVIVPLYPCSGGSATDVLCAWSVTEELFVNG